MNAGFDKVVWGVPPASLRRDNSSMAGERSSISVQYVFSAVGNSQLVKIRMSNMTGMFLNRCSRFVGEKTYMNHAG